MDLLPKQQRTSTAPTSDSGIGRGMEMALLLLLFLGIGYVLDRIFDTKPVFMIVMAVLAIAGQFASLWYSYSARMRELEQERRDNTRRGKAATS